MANFQFVLDEAVGEYFMWAAADDRWDAGWLDALVKLLGPGVCIAFGSVVSVQDGNSRGSRETLKSLEGPRILRMLRYYLWNNSSCGKANAIYGVFRTDEIRGIATEVFRSDGDRMGSDVIFVFALLQFGGLRIEPNVVFYKRTRYTAGLQPIVGGMLLKWRQLGPYLLEHVRRSPPGITRFAVLAVTPMKYGWQIWRGIRRVAILSFSSLTGKKLSVGRI
jgi:hypothetical protein